MFHTNGLDEAKARIEAGDYAAPLNLVPVAAGRIGYPIFLVEYPSDEDFSLYKTCWDNFLDRELYVPEALDQDDVTWYWVDDKAKLDGKGPREIRNDPSNTICGVKSLLGRKWSDPELQSIINGLDYRVVEIDDNPMILANINGTETTMSPERVQGFLFRKMKAIAEQFLEHDIEIDDLVGGLSFVGVLTPSDFVTINDAYLDLKAVRQLLDDLKLSTKDIDDVIIARGSAHIPEIQNRLEGFFERKSPLQGTSLDDAIVIGTAMQGAALSAEEPTSACLFCIDSCPLSVGVNAAGGIFKRIISRKTLLPVRRAQSFTTAVDGQSSMLIQVFEGGRMFSGDNRLLGELVILVIQPEPKGNATIEPYGTLAVIAIDTHIGNKTKMVMDILERDRVLDQGFEMQYDHILADAEEHADEDQVLREITIAHLQVDNAIPAPEGQTGGNAPQRDEL
ncbi:putative Endoplasmic reticulum chaperone BiP [Seiridium cardinale]